jgi:S1-C subfamily serine protease
MAVTLTADQAPRAWLGLGFTMHRDEATGRTWLYVRGVAPNGPSQRAGVLARDLITAINGRPIAFPDDRAALAFFARIPVASRVRLTLVRGNTQKIVTITAVPLPAEQQQTWKENQSRATKH